MSKFNKRAEEARPNSVNRAGGASFKIEDAKKELASVILSSMLRGDNYYQSESARIAQVFDLVKAQNDKEFAAKAMVYVRDEGNLRSVSHIMANALVESASGNPLLRRAIKRAVVRPDDMIEMAALWFSRHPSKMLPNSMRRAFRDLLESNKWDAYQLKKYLNKNNAVKLRDIVLLTHPRDPRGLLKGVIEDTISAPQTLETKLASGEKASEAFEDMLREGRLGYMAAVKNIRNALETGISDEVLDLWCDMIADPRRVRKSRMLPFRFVDAWNEVKGLNIDAFKKRKIKTAFNRALTASAENLEFIDSSDRIAIVIDESGSMRRDFHIGLTLAAVLYSALPRDQVVVYFFDDKVREVDFDGKSPLDIIDSFNNPEGGATYFNKPMEKLINSGTFVDRLILFTDMQLYSSIWYGAGDSFVKYLNEYRRRVNPKVKTLFWDLRGYGNSTPAELKDNILLASGFSDKLLAVIPKMWRSEDALIREIEEIKL